MSCCGSKRYQWQQYAATPEPQQKIQKPVLANPVEIQFHGRGSLLIKGEQTGYLYLFGDQDPRLMIDHRDVPFVLADAKRFSLA